MAAGVVCGINWQDGFIYLFFILLSSALFLYFVSSYFMYHNIKICHVCIYIAAMFSYINFLVFSLYSLPSHVRVMCESCACESCASHVRAMCEPCASHVRCEPCASHVRVMCELSPAYILTISPRFTVAAPVFTQHLRSRLLIRRIVFLRRCVNTGAPTVNRGEIVSMYAGLYVSSLYLTTCVRNKEFVLKPAAACVDYSQQ